MRWCWVNFQCQGVLQFGYSRARAYCARSRCGCLDIFTLVYPFSPLSPSLWETARYRLKYCLKGPLNPKQPTNLINCNKCPYSNNASCLFSKNSFILTCANSCLDLWVQNHFELGFSLKGKNLLLLGQHGAYFLEIDWVF